VQGYLFGRPQPATEVAATILRALRPSPAEDTVGKAGRRAG